MRSTHAAVALGLVALAAGFAACSGGGETGTSTATGAGGAMSTTDSTTTTTTATMSGGGATSSSVTGAGGAGGATSSSATTSTGGPVYGFCTKPCGTVSNCCPPMLPAGTCPTDKYPYNYECDMKYGACKSPQCTTTADCAMLDPSQGCLVLSGQHICGETCTVGDPKCSGAGTSCSGTDDLGTTYCLSAGGGGCTDDASCSGFGKCVNKVCVCEKSADCTKAGFTACAL